MTRKGIRILVQSLYYPPRLGGLESHAHYLAKTLVSLGHEVSVVTSNTEGSPSMEVLDGVRVRRFAFPLKNFVGWILTTLFSIPHVLKSVKDYDVLHAHTFLSAIPFILSGRRPLVVTVHTSHFLKLAGKPVFKPLLRLILSRADLVLATSDEIAETCRTVSPGSRVESVVNGVDTSLFKPVKAEISDSRKIILCHRRLVEKNGVEYLVRAMPYILENIDARLYLIGDGPERVMLESIIDSLGIRDDVVLLGPIANSKLPGYLSSADVVVVPSLMEATSISALEALSCGRPVAASDVGGLPQIITPKVGVLFNPGDPQDAAEKIVGLLSNPDASMGRAARESVVANWDWIKVAKIHEAFYAQLLSS